MSVLLQEDAGYTSEIDLANAAVCRRETFVFTVTEPDAPYMGLKSATVADGVLKLVVKGAEDYIAGDSVVIHVSGMTNYTDTTIITVTYTDKTIVTIAGMKPAAT